jgi:hypothetical protein
MAAMWIDHVVRGVVDMDAAAAQMRAEFGLGSVVGGRHPGWGTGNRIVPLGRTYIELIGIVDAEEAAGSPVGRGLAAWIAGGDRWRSWCVATDDLDSVADRVGLSIDHGSRVRPDGATLRWRSAGFLNTLENPSLPFFISWEIPPDLHPGGDRADHGNEPRGISWVEVGADDRLDAWLAGAELPVRQVPGPPGLLAVAVASSAGEIVIR